MQGSGATYAEKSQQEIHPTDLAYSPEHADKNGKNKATMLPQPSLAP
jgi:hypothetical protein